ncbi:hypothetical protein LguiB_024620 [Lonicera macranthoides]
MDNQMINFEDYIEDAILRGPSKTCTDELETTLNTIVSKCEKEAWIARHEEDLDEKMSAKICESKKLENYEKESSKRNIKEDEEVAKAADESNHHHVVPTSGICRPLFDILKELNKKVPDSLVKLYRTNAEIFCESTGMTSTSEVGYGDPVDFNNSGDHITELLVNIRVETSNRNQFKIGCRLLNPTKCHRHRSLQHDHHISLRFADEFGEGRCGFRENG